MVAPRPYVRATAANQIITSEIVSHLAPTAKFATERKIPQGFVLRELGETLAQEDEPERAAGDTRDPREPGRCVEIEHGGCDQEGADGEREVDHGLGANRKEHRVDDRDRQC